MVRLTLWSAGKGGKIAKKHRVCGILIMALWFACIISMAFGTSYFDVKGYNIGSISTVAMIIFFCGVTSFIPFIAYSVIHYSNRALRRNHKFTLEIIENTERYKFDGIDTSKIVFGDKSGIVLSPDRQAYDDWSFFYKIESLGDFYEAKRLLGVDEQEEG